MKGIGLASSSLEPCFATTHRLLTVICNARAHALLEATGCHEALDKHRLPSGLAATRRRLHELTRGTRAITPAPRSASKYLLGEHAETWMARQARHDIYAERGE